MKSLPPADYYYFFKIRINKTKQNKTDAKCILSEIPFCANKQPKALTNYGYN